MKNRNEGGFSLIEVLIVMVIIGILAVLTFPYASRAKGAAENSSAYATLKSMVAAQYSFYSQNSRYARLDELNNSQYQVFGTFQGSALRRGNFTFQMSPLNPSDEELRQGFVIVATKAVTNNETPVVYTVNERGHTTTIFE
jgi:prepilin-type N-terminal cleavage/methylation domain